MQSNDLDKQSNIEQIQSDCNVSNVNDTKKKKTGRGWLLTAIVTGMAALLMSYSFVGSLITTIIDINDSVDDIIASTPMDQELIPDTLWERYELYKEFNDVSQWNYEKYAAPILQKAKDAASDGCDNYKVKVAGIVNLGDYLLLRAPSEIDVDGNVAHGTMEVVFYDGDVREYDPETDEYTDEYYENTNIEFYRVLDSDKITTYMSVDGENWYKTEGTIVNDGHVLFDIKAFVDGIDAKNANWFPGYYNNDEFGNQITVSTIEPSYDGILVNEGFLYHECDSYSELVLTLHADNYLPAMVAQSTSKVHEERLYSCFGSTGDKILEKLCEYDITIWPVYRFSHYGEIGVELPDELASAQQVDDFSDLFIDLYAAIDQYANRADWG